LISLCSKSTKLVILYFVKFIAAGFYLFLSDNQITIIVCIRQQILEGL